VDAENDSGDEKTRENKGTVYLIISILSLSLQRTPMKHT
jgi:hypothetical protein